MSYSIDDDPIVSYQYSYDNNGNITQINENGITIAKYTYDDLNQLESAAEKSQALFTEYSYNNGGNITSKRFYALTSDLDKGSLFYSISYNYDNSYWKDKLISFSGTSITYDQIGNPLNYRNGMTMTWQNGRELASITKSNTTYSFKYNLDGLRTEKSVGGSKTNYYYDSNNNLIGIKKGNDTILFYHDIEGGLVSMSVGDDTYLFVKNLQGDVTKILDDSGDVLVNYTYDAWGKVLSTKNGNGQNITDQSSIAFLNPFRYRGYVYDSETQLYYLQSRYYDPITGRFINADSPDYTDTFSGSPLSTNMFAYCENNPVMMSDASGEDAIWLKAPNSARLAGHTSLLIQDSKNMWWYFYYGPNSIQLFCAGKHIPVYLNNFVDKLINLFNQEYKKKKTEKFNDKNHVNIKNTDTYMYGLYFKGNFSKSFSFVLENMYSYSYNHSRRLFVTKWRKSHPYSFLLTPKKGKGIVGYDALSHNCMHVSVQALMYGTLSDKKRQNDFLYMLSKILHVYRVPNYAYEWIKGFGIERKIK